MKGRCFSWRACMYPALIFLGILILLLLSGVIAFRLADRTNGTLISAGEKRDFLLYVPESYDPARPVPMVITLHGFAQWPAHQMYISRWNELADEHGFIVVYPGGTCFPKRWRTGGSQDASADVQFISDLIDKLQQDYNIDSTRIYANGLSNGGGMSFALACTLSDRIAAIGIVAGALPEFLGKLSARPACPRDAIPRHGRPDRPVWWRQHQTRAKLSGDPCVDGCPGTAKWLPGKSPGSTVNRGGEWDRVRWLRGRCHLLHDPRWGTYLARRQSHPGLDRRPDEY